MLIQYTDGRTAIWFAVCSGCVLEKADWLDGGLHFLFLHSCNSVLAGANSGAFALLGEVAPQELDCFERQQMAKAVDANQLSRSTAVQRNLDTPVLHTAAENKECFVPREVVFEVDLCREICFPRAQQGGFGGRR